MKTENKKTNIPEGWKMTRLGEVAEINPSESLNKGKMAKYVAMESIEPFTRRISNFTLKEFNGGMKFRNGDTLFARITPCLENGKTSFVDILEDYEIGFGSTEFIVLREKENLSDKKYLYYLSLSPRLREIAVRLMTGSSGRQRVQTNLFADENFVIPPLPEQHAIAAVLSSFDDKIELLREQNKTLEAIAQALYKRWFVDFEFPMTEQKSSQLPSLAGGELKGYKSSGGKMVESELGEIPEGWRVEQITELFDFIKGIEPGSSNYVKCKMSDEYIPFYRVQNVSGSNNIPDIFIGKSLSNGKIFEENDILVSLDGTIGKVFVGGSGSYSSGIRKVIGKKNSIGKCLIYCFLKSDYFQNGLILFSSGETTIKHAGKSLEHLKFIYNKDIYEQFTKITNPVFKKMIINLAQIQTLSTIRDALLPKLMSGKIRVPTTTPFGHPSLAGETTPAAEGCHPSLKGGEFEDE